MKTYSLEVWGFKISTKKFKYNVLKYEKVK